MILSTSSSRAVSIRIGTSERCRIRRQTSIPSRSGSIRSRTISEGGSRAGLLERLGAVRGDADLEAGLLEVHGDERGDVRLVLDDEDALAPGLDHGHV